MGDYNVPERKAGYSDSETETYGDAVLMTWRDRVGLRKRIRERHKEVSRDRTGFQLLREERGYIDALE